MTDLEQWEAMLTAQKITYKLAMYKEYPYIELVEGPVTCLHDADVTIYFNADGSLLEFETV